MLSHFSLMVCAACGGMMGSVINKLFHDKSIAFCVKGNAEMR